MKELEGFDELIDSLENIEEVLSHKALRKVTRKGAGHVLRAVRAAAPSDTGLLREGIILHAEKSRTKGKVAYDVYMDPEKNSAFQKPITNPVRSKSPYGYYPASQEYGYFTRRPDGSMVYTRSDGTKARMDKVPGKHYMLLGAEAAEESAKNTIVDGVMELIEKEYDS